MAVTIEVLSAWEEIGGDLSNPTHKGAKFTNILISNSVSPPPSKFLFAYRSLSR